MTIYYKLPDDSYVVGSGWTLIGEQQYQLTSMSNPELAAIGVEKSTVDERFYYLSANGELLPYSIEQIRGILKSQVGNDRWNAENAGIMWQSFWTQTDRASRTNYANMVDMVYQGMRQDNSIYKFMDGPHPLANADVEPLATAVNQYVQTLFDHEAELWVQIDALANIADAEQFSWTFAGLKSPATSELDMGPTIGETLGGSINVKS